MVIAVVSIIMANAGDVLGSFWCNISRGLAARVNVCVWCSAGRALLCLATVLWVENYFESVSRLGRTG